MGSLRTPIAARFLGKNDFRPGPFSLGPLSAPVALISVLWMLFMGVVFLFPTTPAPSTPDMNYTVVVLFGTLFLSLVWYYFPRYGGVHWFTGPIATIKGEDEPEGGSVTVSHGTEDEKKGSQVRVGVQEV